MSMSKWRMKFQIFKEIKTCNRSFLPYCDAHSSEPNYHKKEKKEKHRVGTLFFFTNTANANKWMLSSIDCSQENKVHFAECVSDGLISDWLLWWLFLYLQSLGLSQRQVCQVVETSFAMYSNEKKQQLQLCVLFRYLIFTVC